MARTASMTAQEAETILGQRGHIRVDSTNRAIVRKWLTAQGLPSGFVCGLSMTELGLAYNQTDGSGLSKLHSKLQESIDDGVFSQDEPPAQIANEVNSNGHAIHVADTLGDGTTIEQAIRAIAATVVPKAAGIDESAVRAIVDKAIAGIPARVLEIRQSDKAPVTIEGKQHPHFERLLKACTAREPSGYVPNILLRGEASSGKTTACKFVAKALSLDWHFNGAISMPHEMLGFIDAGGTYHRTAFRNAYEHGGVYTFDEMDRSDNSALLAVNPHLANGVATFPDGQIKRHKDCLIIGTANTWGLGADANYCGAAKLDGAFLSRFPVRVNWDIDEFLEREISGHESWARKVQGARAKARNAGLKVMIDVRMTIAGAALIAAGMTETEAFDMTVLANLTSDQQRIVRG